MENTTRRLLNGGAYARNANMCVSYVCEQVVWEGGKDGVLDK